MNTIEQPKAADDGSRMSTGSRFGARTGARDMVLLLVTIVALMALAAGIAIAFPPALELVASQAIASTAVDPACYSQDRRSHLEDENEEEDEPFVADDIRNEGLIPAAAATTGSVDRSAPEIHTVNR
jgi:hypothetical protein